MPRYRAIAAITYLVLAPLMAYAAGEDPSSEGTWIVLIVLVTLVAGAVVGRWSVVLVTVLSVAMVLAATLGPCDPEVAYSCDPSVDPWWPMVLINTVVLSVVLAFGAVLGWLLSRTCQTGTPIPAAAASLACSSNQGPAEQDDALNEIEVVDGG
ncbi:MAG TPA: hypothetical protein VL120_16575 [Solirubrobacteraceae bacterium]|jgi:hypothetical protein|nr:hypothetical protein [Solirubrobacteraceae bacterium]